ncbi:MAG: ABC transporter permease [Ktedonobacterales bacterium]|nr:ABC transporter permease [Ktedonobacterales bacterium]
MPEPRRAFTALVGVHLRELRSQLAPLLIFTVLLPLALAAALNAMPTLVPPYAPGNQPSTLDLAATTSERGAFILAAALMATLLGIAWGVLPQQLAQMRNQHQFDFFAGFPVGRVTYLLALLVAYAIVALPGVLLVPTLTALALKATVSANPAFLIVVPLCFLALTTTGGALGLARLSTATTVALSAALYLLGVGVLGLPATGSLGGAAHTLAFLSPATLATDLLNATLPHHGGTSALVLDGVGLGLYTAGAAYLVQRLLPWRVSALQPQTGG